ncbi:MAG: helicase-associated domain-containing protein [Sporolactobacillus sp.]|nr:helicase-associated domain-containing protein [Sporolactobacillus sp.]
MQAAEFLGQLPKRDVRKVARFFGLKPKDYLKADAKQLAKKLAPQYGPQALERHLQKLTEAESTMLALLCMNVDEGIGGVDLQRRSGGIGSDIARKHVIIDALISKGLVFAAQVYWRRCLCVPDEVYGLVMEKQLTAMIEQEKADLPTYRDEDVTPSDRTGLASHHDMLHVLATLAHENVPVTQQGDVYKRWKKRMAEECRLGDKWFAPVGYHSDSGCAAIDFWLSYARQVGLISLFPPSVEIHTGVLAAFLHVSYTQWSLTFYQYYVDRLQMLHAARPFPVFICLRLFCACGLSWVSRGKVFQMINKWCNHNKIAFDRQAFDRFIYRPLILFGLIETGKVGQQDVWRLTEWARATDLSDEADTKNERLTEAIYVQPNLEIIVPENILPAICWRIETFAHMKKADTALIFEWSKERLQQSVEAGWSFAQIRDFIRRYSKLPVPENVWQTIADWTSDYGKIKLWDVFVVQINDPQAAATIRNDRKMKKMIVTSFAPNVCVIRRKDSVPFCRALALAGFPAIRTVFSPDEPKECSPAGRNNKTVAINHKSYAPDQFQSAFSRQQVEANVLTFDAETGETDDGDQR